MADLEQTGSDRVPKKRGRIQKPGWKPVFLAELERWGVVEHAAKEAGVAARVAYKARQTDRTFAAAWDEAEGRIVAVMEVVARQRALTGHRVPVIFQGKVVDHVQEVDNGLLKWLLAKKKPEVYGDKQEEKPPPQDINVNVSIDVKQLSDDELRAIDEAYDLALSRNHKNGAGKT